MNEEEAIKKKMMEQLSAQQQASDNNEAQIDQQLAVLENIVKQKMTKAALQRFGTLKTAHPEIATQAMLVFGQAIQSGNVDKIDDQILKNILIKIAPKKKDINIVRK